jgi:excisionase family DNA binding protein
VEKLLTVDEAAAQLRTTARFVRRLIEERRIAYIKLGTHVRIEGAELAAFISASRVVPPNRTSKARAA